MKFYIIENGPIVLGEGGYFYTYHALQTSKTVFDLRSKHAYLTKTAAIGMQKRELDLLRKEHGIQNCKQKRQCTKCGEYRLTKLPPLETGERLDAWVRIKCRCGGVLNEGYQVGFEDVK